MTWGTARRGTIAIRTTTTTTTTDRGDRDDPASPQHPPNVRQAPRREDEDDDGHHHCRKQRLVGWKRAALTMEREQDNDSNRDNSSHIMTPPHFAWGQVFFSLFCIVAPSPSHLPQGGGFSFFGIYNYLVPSLAREVNYLFILNKMKFSLLWYEMVSEIPCKKPSLVHVI